MPKPNLHRYIQLYYRLSVDTWYLVKCCTKTLKCVTRISNFPPHRHRTFSSFLLRTDHGIVEFRHFGSFHSHETLGMTNVALHLTGTGKISRQRPVLTNQQSWIIMAESGHSPPRPIFRSRIILCPESIFLRTHRVLFIRFSIPPPQSWRQCFSSLVLCAPS